MTRADFRRTNVCLTFISPNHCGWTTSGMSCCARRAYASGRVQSYVSAIITAPTSAMCMKLRENRQVRSTTDIRLMPACVSFEYSVSQRRNGSLTTQLVVFVRWIAGVDSTDVRTEV
jgi:hypothetical protein